MTFVAARVILACRSTFVHKGRKYVLSLANPHKEKSNGVTSRNRGGHDIGPIGYPRRFGKRVLRYLRTITVTLQGQD